MSHENSESKQRPDSKWINVYGGTTRPLPLRYPYEKAAYDTVEEAVAAVARRSDDEGKREKGLRSVEEIIWGKP